MERCPNCESTKTIHYPRGTHKDNSQEFWECCICECEFLPYNEGINIFKPGKSVLLS